MESLKEKIKLAIICPVVNCLSYTKMLIETIQTVYDYKLIIIDNNSTDGTKQYCKQLKKIGKLTYIRNDFNMGVASSWNLGIQIAKKQHLCNTFFIPNNDIILKKCTIDRLVENLEIPNICLTTATNVAKELGELTNISEMRVPIIQKLTDDPDFSCFMINNSTLEKVGYFDENYWPAYFEDNDYHYRIKLKELRGAKDNQALYYHFGSITIKENAETSKQSNENYIKNKEYYKSKWGGEPGNEAYSVPFNQWQT